MCHSQSEKKHTLNLFFQVFKNGPPMPTTAAVFMAKPMVSSVYGYKRMNRASRKGRESTLVLLIFSVLFKRIVYIFLP